MATAAPAATRVVAALPPHLAPTQTQTRTNTMASAVYVMDAWASVLCDSPGNPRPQQIPTRTRRVPLIDPVGPGRPLVAHVCRHRVGRCEGIPRSRPRRSREGAGVRVRQDRFDPARVAWWRAASRG